MLPPEVVLSLVAFNPEGELVYAQTYPCKRHKIGDLVPTTRGPKNPSYVIDNHRYPVGVLRAAVSAKDPALLVPAPTGAPQTPLRPRDREMLDAMRSGATYAEIGARYGLSRQRVKQIADLLVTRGYSVPNAEILRRETRMQAQKDYSLARYGHHAESLAANPELRAYLGARLTRLKQRAGREGVPFDITVSDLFPLPTHCPVLGTPLVYHGPSQGALDDYLSVDRIVPELGYTRGNTVLVSARANRLKNNATLDELQKLAQFYCARPPQIPLTTQNKA